MGRYIRGTIDEVLDLGTLAASDAILAAFDEVVNERTLVSSIVVRYSMTNFTAAAGKGPILVGIAHSDYDAPQIEAWIETTGSWDEGNKTEQEVNKRLIRRVGIFEIPSSLAESSVLNDGKAIKTKMNWILNQGQTLSVWAYNLGTGALATTDPRIDVQGHANLWPR